MSAPANPPVKLMPSKEGLVQDIFGEEWGKGLTQAHT